MIRILVYRGQQASWPLPHFLCGLILVGTKGEVRDQADALWSELTCCAAGGILQICSQRGPDTQALPGCDSDRRAGVSNTASSQTSRLNSTVVARPSTVRANDCEYRVEAWDDFKKGFGVAGREIAKS